MKLDEANKIMGAFNKSFKKIKDLKNEVDTKRMHKQWAHPMFEGIRECYLEMCKLQSDLEKVILDNKDTE